MNGNTTNRPVSLSKSLVSIKSSRKGYTLVEILVATTLTMILLVAVVEMFRVVGRSITDSRSMLEASEQLRSTAARLQMDLQGVTVTMLPPRKPEDGEGYFEYIEGPAWQTSGTSGVSDATMTPVNSDTSAKDTTVGDFDDVLMFTTRSTGRPFIGLYGGSAVQSDVAEVVWFLRGRTLHRRQLLVRPDLTVSTATGFFANNDISVRLENSSFLANSLGDLTKRENRFGHPGTSFPFDARLWGQYEMPTLYECSSSSWNAASPTTPSTSNPKTNVDFWTNDSSQRLADNALGTGSRIAEDVILNNVIGFDVKIWDPVAGAYVDLGGSGSSTFSGYGTSKSQLQGSSSTARVYDTWSTHYESIGLASGYANAGIATNGFDDDGNGLVDDANEQLTAPPYPYPCRGIQVKIRIFEPDSRQISELTIVQEFLPK